MTHHDALPVGTKVDRFTTPQGAVGCQRRARGRALVRWADGDLRAKTTHWGTVPPPTVCGVQYQWLQHRYSLTVSDKWKYRPAWI